MNPGMEALFLSWLVKGLVTLLLTLVAWVAVREIKRLDKRVNEESTRLDKRITDEANALKEKVDTEVKYRDSHLQGLDSEVGSLRARQHELGNTVSGHAGTITTIAETMKETKEAVQDLRIAVADLRVLMAEIGATFNGRRHD